MLLGLQASGQTRAILTGKLLLVGPVRRRVEEIGSMLGDRIVVPQRGEVASALGALWSIREGVME